MGGNKPHALAGKPRVGKPRGNPLWCHKPEPFAVLIVHLSGFEKKADELHLKPNQYALSLELREWARKSVKSRYVPEDLLEVWGIPIDNTDLYN